MIGNPMAVSKAPRVITSSRLATCGVLKKGQVIHLGFFDDSGQPTSVELPFEQATSLILTLPHLISRAVAMQTNDPMARCVFALRQWTVERADNDGLILTLNTDDGFGVSFRVPFDTCKAIGFALRHEVESASDQFDEPRPSNPAALN
ncbi:MAG TPA: hypothetical protein VHU22_19125 [Xanthobacteraceae bacterium]|nr:hypothetical protein [Xanthobacteraceae bacterium]